MTLFVTRGYKERMIGRIAAHRCLWALVVAITSVRLSAQTPDTPAPETPPPYAVTEDTYRALSRRPSLARRTDGRRHLAATADPRAFATLSAVYADPEQPHEFVRSLLVSMLADHFTESAHAELWRNWRVANSTAGDAWLWYNAVAQEGLADRELWRTLVQQKMPVELRAATLIATTERPRSVPLDDETLGLITDFGAGIGTRSYERAVLLEALVGLFTEQPLPPPPPPPAPPADAPDAPAAPAAPAQPPPPAIPPSPLGKPQRTILRSLAYAMAEPATTARSRIVLARLLARALHRDNLGPDAATWIELLGDAPAAEIEMAYALKRGAARPGFFGITEHGRAIAYVIDASDSMLQPLTPRERQDLQPLTGKEGVKAPAPGPGTQAELAIDWTKVKTRFDGARELLKLALRRLTPEQQFTIVLFGNKAEHLTATPQLVAATPKAIAAACRDLDAIRPGPNHKDRPYGTLRGQTNLHGGLLRAFRTGEAKSTDPKARSDVRAFEYGVDTIFVLSDGAPNADDWDAVDANESGRAGDPEAGTSYRYEGDVVYPGPFAYGFGLLEDLRRLNLLRRCAIHTVGIGEADYDLLQRIAAVGHGTTVQIGKQ